VNGQFTSATVYEHRQRDSRRPPEIGELAERRPHRSSGIQDIIDYHDVFSVQIPRQVGRTYDRARADSLQIVAIKRDVE